MIDKSKLRDALVAQLHNDWELQTRAAHLARDEATNEESRAESKWDTRGQEAAYLAEGQAKLAAELAEAITRWRNLVVRPVGPDAVIGLGSVFVIKQLPVPLRGFMGPRAGGTEFSFADHSYTVVTPTSPLGRAVMGRRAGDWVDLMVQRQPVPHQISDVY